MSRFCILLVFLLTAFSLQHSEGHSEKLGRIFSVVQFFQCREGFITFKEQNCIVKCVNATNPSDIVEPYILHERLEQEGCCTRTTYLNEDYECTVTRCQDTQACALRKFKAAQIGPQPSQADSKQVLSGNEYPS